MPDAGVEEAECADWIGLRGAGLAGDGGHFLDGRAEFEPVSDVGQVVGVALVIVGRIVVDASSVPDQPGNLVHAVRFAPALSFSFFFIISLSLSLSLGGVFPGDIASVSLGTVGGLGRGCHWDRVAT